MANQALGTTMQWLRHSVASTDLTDGELLQRFVHQGHHIAFEQLVRRHGPMVLAVCRRILGNSHDAEDAFQATFVVLTRKAAVVTPPDLVGNWLYGVARRVAAKAKAEAGKRRQRERVVARMPMASATDTRPDIDLVVLVDAAIERLPRKYRLPVVLCHLEGRGRKDVARQLGIPEGTLSSLLARARTMLARCLTSRGVAMSVGPVLAACEADAAGSLPIALLSATVRTAAGTGTAWPVSARVLALSRSVLRSMLVRKIAIVAVLCSLGLAVGTGGVIAARKAHWAFSQERPNSAPELSALKSPEGRTEDALSLPIEVHHSGGDATSWALVRVPPGKSVQVPDIQGIAIGAVRRDELIIVRAGRPYVVTDAPVLHAVESAREPCRLVEGQRSRLKDQSRQMRVEEQDLQRERRRLQRGRQELEHRKADADDRQARALDDQIQELRRRDRKLAQEAAVIKQQLQTVNDEMQALARKADSARNTMVSRIADIFQSTFERDLAHPIPEKER